MKQIKQNTTLSIIGSLKLSFVAEHYEALAQEAARKTWTYVDYLSRVIEGEANARQEKKLGESYRRRGFQYS